MRHKLVRCALGLGGVAIVALAPPPRADASPTLVDQRSPARETEPSWQHLPGLDHGHANALVEVGWASGRAWFMIGSPTGLTLGSARPVGARLTSQRTIRIPVRLDWYPFFLGSEIYYPSSPSASAVSPFLPSGDVGEAVAPSPEPMASEVGIPAAATRVGGRIVWVLVGGVPVGEAGIHFRPALWVCCDAAGLPRDLSKLATLRVGSPPRKHALGVDAEGRLWLAWVDGPPGRIEIRMVQLDPTTLAPLTQDALVVPVPRIQEPGLQTWNVPLVCSSTCRVVAGSTAPLPTGGVWTRIVTWAPGERAATRVKLPPSATDRLHPRLITATMRGGRLAIAYLEPGAGLEPLVLRVAVGDARGRRPRLAGSIGLPGRSRGRDLYTFAEGAFTPGGFVFGQTYSNQGLRGHVLATFIPIR